MNPFHILLAVLFACGATQATAEVRAGTANSVETGNAIRMELIAQPREVELPSRFHLALRFTNGTAESVVFRNFSLIPLEEPGGLEVSKECASQRQTVVGPHSSFMIACAVSSREFNDSIGTFGGALFASWSLLTFQPGEYRFVATSQVRRDDEALLATSETVTIRIRPSVWQICIGASLGALFLVLFTFSSVKARTAFLKGDRLHRMSGWRLWLAEPLLLWLGATISASIFIFLTYRLKDVSSPLTITVNDFYGGLVIGLFGVFIADHLAARFYSGGKGEKNPDGETTPESDRGPT